MWMIPVGIHSFRENGSEEAQEDEVEEQANTAKGTLFLSFGLKCQNCVNLLAKESAEVMAFAVLKIVVTMQYVVLKKRVISV